jgi:hypothetical protein
MTRLKLALTLGALGVSALAGCRGQTATDPPIVPIRNMHSTPRYNPQARSGYFADGRTMRPPVAEAISVEMELDSVRDTGLDDAGAYALTVPTPVVEEAGGLDRLLDRGHQRYDIYCGPCHGGLGDGEGMVPRVSRVPAIQPPPFH